MEIEFMDACEICTCGPKEVGPIRCYDGFWRSCRECYDAMRAIDRKEKRLERKNGRK